MPAGWTGTAFAIVLFQEQFGVLSVWTGPGFAAYGSPPTRVLFVGMRDESLWPFRGYRSGLLPQPDLHRTLAVADHLRAPAGVCLYHWQ